jgi:hypothetical protein
MKSTNLAIKLNIKHQNIIQHITKNINLFKDLGFLEKLTGETTENGGRPDNYYELNDLQIKFLITLIKNDNVIKIIKKEIILNTFDIENFKKEPIQGYVYIIKNINGYKIGSSINPKKRIRAIETQQGCNVETILISDKRYDYKIKENELHNLYKNKNVIGEYFNLDDNDLSKIICNLYDTSPNNLKFAVSKWFYDNDRKAFYDLYLMDLAKALDKKRTQMYILDSTLIFAKNIIAQNKGKSISDIYNIIRNELPNIIDVVYNAD